jgi:hypothetical protein
MKTRAQKSGKRFLGSVFRTALSGSKRVQFFATAAMVATMTAAIGLSSCAGYTTNAAGTTSQNSSGTGILSASTSTLDFGNVPVGTSASQTLTLTDTGTASVSISGVTVSGTGFSVVGGNFTGTVGVGQSVAVQLQFTPQTAGSITGDVTITSNASSISAASITTSSLITAAASTNSSFKVALHGNATEPVLSIAPGSLSFSNVTVGQSGNQTVTLTNTGTANLQLKAATITGAGLSVSGLTTPQMIPAGQGISFTVQYSPTSAGSVSGSISFSDDAPGTPQTLPITATAVSAAGTLSANPASYNFNSVLIGNSSTQTITLKNSGTANVTVNSISTSGAAFSATGLSAGQTIAPGASASLTATFTPTTAGSTSGTISVLTNASNPTLSVALSGTGTATQAQLSISPSSLAFGGVNVGSTTSQTVTLTNSGNATLNITAATISGAGYTMTLAPTTISAGANAKFSVNFAPIAEGSAPGKISITSNAPGSPASVGVSGTGLEALGSANPMSVAFGNVVVGSSNSDVVTLKNTGNATLSFSQVSVSGSGFSTSGLSTSSTVPAGGSLNFDAVFTPASATSASGSITLATNGSPAQISIPLTGTGTAATQTLSVSSSSLSFGNVQVGSTNTLTASITNSGNSNLSISGVTVTGAGYTTSGVTSGMILSPSQSVTLTVNFAPTSLGSDPGTISIASNATNSPTTISVSGESHTVLLTWTGSTSTGVTGYYVYRGTQSGQYTKLNASSPASGTQFTDTTVAAGTTYNYVVTAVDSSGAESSYSSPATVSVP